MKCLRYVSKKLPHKTIVNNFCSFFGLLQYLSGLTPSYLAYVSLISDQSHDRCLFHNVLKALSKKTPIDQLINQSIYLANCAREYNTHCVKGDNSKKSASPKLFRSSIKRTGKLSMSHVLPPSTRSFKTPQLS